MTGNGLVLSLFPGADVFGRGFEEADYCVVKGPDVLFGGDVRDFHPPVGAFEGVIGGPPCQVFSRFRYVNPKAGQKHGNLIPEFERVVGEAQPVWFVMENVPEAPEPSVPGYAVRQLLYDNRWAPEMPEQHRVRRFSFGTRTGLVLQPAICALQNPRWAHAVAAGAAGREVPVALQRDGQGGHKIKKSAARSCGYQSADRLRRACELQGLPPDWLDEAPFTLAGKFRVVGNAVSLFTARAIAQAVRRATQPQEVPA
jgi:DNA (cytosine-5)-methyltransferase 1